MYKTKKFNIIVSLVYLDMSVISLPYAINELRYYKTSILIVCFLVLVGFLLGLMAVFLEEKHFFQGENTSKTLWHIKIGLFFLIPLFSLTRGEVKIFVLLVLCAYGGTLAFFYLRRALTVVGKIS
jgi:hypothetical protein